MLNLILTFKIQTKIKTTKVEWFRGVAVSRVSPDDRPAMGVNETNRDAHTENGTILKKEEKNRMRETSI